MSSTEALPTLAELATTLPGASRVFQRHRLDFCCQGRRTLAEACRAAGLDAAAIRAEIEREGRPAQVAWNELPVGEAVDEIERTYHASHRRELPALVELATKVERVHGERAECPRGLAEHRHGHVLHGGRDRARRVPRDRLPDGARWRVLRGRHRGGRAGAALGREADDCSGRASARPRCVSATCPATRPRACEAQDHGRRDDFEAEHTQDDGARPERLVDDRAQSTECGQIRWASRQSAWDMPALGRPPGGPAVCNLSHAQLCGGGLAPAGGSPDGPGARSLGSTST